MPSRRAGLELEAKRRRSGLGFDAPLRFRSVAEEVESGLIAWCAQAGRRVLQELWEADVEELCGQRWHPNPRSRVARAGWCQCEVVLGGERAMLRRPRVRSHKGREVELPSYRAASARDLLDRNTLEAVAAAISTGASPGNFGVDRLAGDFALRLTQRLEANLARPIGEFAPGLMIGSLAFCDHWFLIALQVLANGERQLVGLRSGSPESRDAAQLLIAELVARADAARPPALFFAGEATAVREALQRHFGRSILIQRCPAEKRRRVLGLLPPALQPGILEGLLAAHHSPDANQALRSLQRIAKSLEAEQPRAAALLREGLEQTLTLQKLGLSRAPAAAEASLPAVAAPLRSDFLV